MTQVELTYHQACISLDTLVVIMSRPGLNRTIINSESKNRSSIELRDD